MIRINNQSGIVAMAVVRFERPWLLSMWPSPVKCNRSLGLGGFQVKTMLLATNEMQLIIHKATKYSQDKTGSKITMVEGSLKDHVAEISKDFYCLIPIHWFYDFSHNFLITVCDMIEIIARELWYSQSRLLPAELINIDFWWIMPNIMLLYRLMKYRL